MFGHLGNMSADELRDHVRKTRSDRRVPKVKAAVKKKAKLTGDANRVKARKMIDKLGNADLLAKLLKDLENGG